MNVFDSSEASIVSTTLLNSIQLCQWIIIYNVNYSFLSHRKQTLISLFIILFSWTRVLCLIGETDCRDEILLIIIVPTSFLKLKYLRMHICSCNSIRLMKAAKFIYKYFLYLQSSRWRKLRNIVQWTPFFQTYKKQRYPWVQLAGHQGNFKAGPDPGTILKKMCHKEEKCFRVKVWKDELWFLQRITKK